MCDRLLVALEGIVGRDEAPEVAVVHELGREVEGTPRPGRRLFGAVRVRSPQPDLALP